MNTDQEYISLCKARIESQFNLNSQNLVQRDFEYLNKVIFDQSGIDVSPATLRRVWTDQHQQVPQIKTLDALAQIIHYDSWHEFKKAHPETRKNAPSMSFMALFGLGWLILLSIVFIKVYSPGGVEVSLTPEKTLHDGVPATIGFSYAIPDDDIVIQLSWNPFERTLLDPDQNFYTGTYFYPDYHEAKLIKKEKILARSFVHITYPTWHGLFMKSGLDPNPIYIDSMDFLKPEGLKISSELLDSYQLTDADELYSVFTFSHSDLENITGDAMSIQTLFQDLGMKSERVCWQTDLVIKGETGSVRVPISFPGCYGLTGVKCSDVILSGKNHDLSSLSFDSSQPTMMNLSVYDKKMTVQVSENEPLTIDYQKPIGKLKVVKFIFMGYGQVMDFRISGQQGLMEGVIRNPFP